MAFPAKGGGQGGGPPWALLPLRLYLGAGLLLSGLDKLTMAERWVSAMADQLQRWRPGSYGIYRSFLDQTVLPHKILVASLVCWGETLVGAALLLGLATRFAALAGLIITLNIVLAKGTLFWAITPETACLFGLSALMLGGAGRFFGIDANLAAKRPAWPFW